MRDPETGRPVATYRATVTVTYEDEFYNDVDLDTAEQKFREVIPELGIKATEVDIQVLNGEGKWLRTVSVTER